MNPFAESCRDLAQSSDMGALGRPWRPGPPTITKVATYTNAPQVPGITLAETTAGKKKLWTQGNVYNKNQDRPVYSTRHELRGQVVPSKTGGYPWQPAQAH